MGPFRVLGFFFSASGVKFRTPKWIPPLQAEPSNLPTLLNPPPPSFPRAAGFHRLGAPSSLDLLVHLAPVPFTPVFLMRGEHPASPHRGLPRSLPFRPKGCCLRRPHFPCPPLVCCFRPDLVFSRAIRFFEGMPKAIAHGGFGEALLVSPLIFLIRFLSPVLPHPPWHSPARVPGKNCHMLFFSPGSFLMRGEFFLRSNRQPSRFVPHPPSLW